MGENAEPMAEPILPPLVTANAPAVALLGLFFDFFFFDVILLRGGGFNFSIMSLLLDGSCFELFGDGCCCCRFGCISSLDIGNGCADN